MKKVTEVLPARFYAHNETTTYPSPSFDAPFWLRIDSNGTWEYSHSIDSKKPTSEILCWYLQRTFIQQDYLVDLMHKNREVYERYMERAEFISRHPHWHMELHARGFKKRTIICTWIVFAMWLSYRRQEYTTPEQHMDSLIERFSEFAILKKRVLDNLNHDAITQLLAKSHGSASANFNINQLTKCLHKTSRW